jgi:threonine dehydratase
MELVEDVGGLDVIVAPIGGGGLISGCCLAAQRLAPSAMVVGAEPANADDALRSLKAGRIISDDAPDTIADGLRASLGEMTWHFVSRSVADIMTAGERGIVDAMYLTWQRMKIVIEPSSAVPVAAILARPDFLAGRRIGVILTGGNVDLDRLPWM